MAFQRIVIRLFDSFIKRVHTIFLPGTLLILYLSAYGLISPGSIGIYSRTSIGIIHFYAGFLLILFCLLIAYDAFNRKVFANANRERFSRKILLVRRLIAYTLYQRFVDSLFYVTLTIMSVLGIILYRARYHATNLISTDMTFLAMIHILGGAFLVSIILLRYYLTLTFTLRRFLNYLKAE